MVREAWNQIGEQYAGKTGCSYASDSVFCGVVWCLVLCFDTRLAFHQAEQRLKISLLQLLTLLCVAMS